MQRTDDTCVLINKLILARDFYIKNDSKEFYTIARENFLTQLYTHLNENAHVDHIKFI